MRVHDTHTVAWSIMSRVRRGVHGGLVGDAPALDVTIDKICRANLTQKVRAAGSCRALRSRRCLNLRRSRAPFQRSRSTTTSATPARQCSTTAWSTPAGTTSRARRRADAQEPNAELVAPEGRPQARHARSSTSAAAGWSRQSWWAARKYGVGCEGPGRRSVLERSRSAWVRRLAPPSAQCAGHSSTGPVPNRHRWSTSARRTPDNVDNGVRCQARPEGSRGTDSKQARACAMHTFHGSSSERGRLWQESAVRWRE